MSDSGTTPLTETSTTTTTDTTCDQVLSSSKPSEPASHPTISTEILPVKNPLEEYTQITDWNDVKTDSDHKLKDKSKSLESEPEQRNTSTSNAGESEYESANEEELLTDDKKLTKCDDDVKVDSVDDNIFTSFDKTDSEADKPPSLPEKVDDVDKRETQEVLTTDNKSDLPHEQSTSESKGLEDDADEAEFDESLDDEEMIDDLEDDSFDDDSLHDEIDDEEKEEIAGEDSVKTAENSLNDDKIDDVVERESGDGEESAKLANEKALAGQSSKGAKRTGEVGKSKRQYIQNPQYIPRAKAYFEHDDRDAEEAGKANKVTEEEETEAESAKLKSKKKPVSSMKLRSDEMGDEEGEKKPLPPRRASKDAIEVINNKVEVERKTQVKTRHELRTEAIWNSGERWSHDCFNEDDQRPKTREELIDHYGYDIRSETEAPKLQRRSKYGKGPQKYSRRPDDQNAYAKKTLRKVIRHSGSPKTPSTTTTNTGDTSDANNNRTSSAKRDRVFDNRSERRSMSSKDTKENHPAPLSPRESNTHASSATTSRPSYSRSSEGSSRMHENDRVFVNKNASASSKFSKMSNSSDRSKMYNNNSNNQSSHNNSSTINKSGGRDANVNNAAIETRSDGGKNNQLFSKDDFPELLSAKSSANAGSGRVIYYQNSSSQVKDTQESRKDSKHFEEPPAKPVVVESAQFENSRYRNHRTVPPPSQTTGHQYYSNSNSNWNNRDRGDRDRNERAKPLPRQEYTNQRLEPSVKKMPQVHVDDELIMGEHHMPPTNEDSRPKRYSSIRQQQRSTVTTHSSTTSSYQPPSVSQPSNGVSVVTTQAKLVPEDNSSSANALGEPKSTVTTTGYYDPSSTSPLGREPTASILPSSTSAAATHHHPTHNYATINGTATPSPAPTAYLPTAGTLLYYDATTGQATGQPAPLGLAQAYYATDQTSAAPTPQAANYYLTPADMTVAYHPAYHLPTANYQSHVASRYLNTTPSPAPSAESNRYLQTTPANQSSTPLLANLSGQPYQATLQSAFPSGYPQFPAASQQNTPTPLPPAGYPNVQLGSSTPATTVSGPQQAVSGYPEMYRGGITYYDVQSQQAMRITQQPPRRTKSISGKMEESGGDPSDLPQNHDGSTHANTKSEIPVNN